MSRRSRRRLGGRRGGFAAIALSAALTGCGDEPAVGNAEPGAPMTSLTAEGSTSAEQSPAPSLDPFPTALAPLTGLPVRAAEVEQRTVVGVAVLTGRDLPPPEGVDRADLVYLSFPGTGRQRLLAMFHSQDADRVGPVADTRPMDAKLMTPFGGVLEHSGGTRGQVTRTDKSEVPQFSAVVHPSAFRREASGALYGSTAVARAAGGVPAQQGLIPFRAADASPVPPSSTTVTVTVTGQDALTLVFDAQAGAWTGSVGQVGVRAANVVVQSVDYDTLTLAQGAGMESDPDVFGEGPATVLTGSRVVAGSWNRPGRRSLTNYVADDGVPIRLVPGATVVVLVPTGTDVQRR